MILLPFWLHLLQYPRNWLFCTLQYQLLFVAHPALQQVCRLQGVWMIEGIT